VHQGQTALGASNAAARSWEFLTIAPSHSLCKQACETLEADVYSICVLSKDLALIYFNPAWCRFGREHRKESTAGIGCGLGTSLASILPQAAEELLPNGLSTGAGNRKSLAS
jgi:hypothetical protein